MVPRAHTLRDHHILIKDAPPAATAYRAISVGLLFMDADRVAFVGQLLDYTHRSALSSGRNATRHGFLKGGNGNEKLFFGRCSCSQLIPFAGARVNG